MLRVVVDTNVFVSGLLKPDSTPGRIVAAWRDAKFRLVVSEFILQELAETLGGEKLKPVLGLQADEIARFVLELRAQSDVVEPAGVRIDTPRDPDDAPILATLIASGADLIVSGDGDLLALRGRYPVETPAEFARRL
jgi:putative PIN family toxin of toxin-antitoxin system